MVLRRWFAHTCVQLRRRKGIHKRYSSTDFSQYSSDETCLADALPIEISLTRYEMRPDCKQRGADGPTLARDSRLYRALNMIHPEQ
jgi:hypothetical protein